MMLKRLLVAAAAATALASFGVAGASQPDHKVDICHHTASATNPYVIINVDRHAVPGHIGRHGHTGPDQEYTDGLCGGLVGR